MTLNIIFTIFYFSSRRRHTRWPRDWSSDVCSSDLIALDHLDKVIELIRGSNTTDIARSGLMEQFDLSEKQAQAILDMRLQRLTGLERNKIQEEYDDLLIKIAEYKAILADEEKVLEIIREELIDIKERFNDERRSEITASKLDFFEDEDLIPEENIVVTLTHKGYIKRLPSDTYRTQNRGGRGIPGTVGRAHV